MKQLAYSRDVEQLLKERRERDEKKRLWELEQIQAHKRDEEREVMLIEEERCRLLEAYGLYDSAAKLMQLLGGRARISSDRFV